MVTISQAANSLWGDYLGGTPGAAVVAVGVSTDKNGQTTIEVWVRGEGPPIPNPWMGHPIVIHKHATHDKFGRIT